VAARQYLIARLWFEVQLAACMNFRRQTGWQSSLTQKRGEIRMNKQDLIARVAQKLDDVPKKAAAKAVEAVFESIAEGLNEDGIVTIGKWGTYTAEDMQ
jgi:uncharacterized protein (DUF2267 family)